MGLVVKRESTRRLYVGLCRVRPARSKPLIFCANTSSLNCAKESGQKMRKSNCRPKQDTSKKQRYVAHFDMLGFSDIVKQKPDLAWEALSTLYDFHAQIPQQILWIESQKRYIQSTAKTIFFSDTIVIYTNHNEYPDYVSIFAQSTNLFVQSLIVGIPLRGGIAYGELRVDKQRGLYMGVPVIEAYETGEDAQWLGIVIHSHTLRVNLKDAAKPYEQPYFVEWNVPKKDCGTRKMAVVNWPQVFKSLFTFPKSTKDLYNRGFSKLFGPYEKLSDSELFKYENTQNFINAQLKGQTNKR